MMVTLDGFAWSGGELESRCISLPQTAFEPLHGDAGMSVDTHTQAMVAVRRCPSPCPCFHQVRWPLKHERSPNRLGSSGESLIGASTIQRWAAVLPCWEEERGRSTQHLSSEPSIIVAATSLVTTTTHPPPPPHRPSTSRSRRHGPLTRHKHTQINNLIASRKAPTVAVSLSLHQNCCCPSLAFCARSPMLE